MAKKQLPPSVQLMHFIVGKWISKPVYAAAELGIADLLADGSMSIEKLAQSSRSHAPSLYRLMRALASVGIFEETGDKRFDLTPMAELLKSGSMRSIALMFNADWSDKAWGCFLDSIKTGCTAFEKAHGLPVSDWLEENPHAAKVFNEANAVKAAGAHRAIADVYDFSGIERLTDVGGGLGVLMAEILNVNTSMFGIVADLPSVIVQAREIINAKGLGDRCQTVACNFFKEIPSGSDAYLLSNILHDWPDEQCHTILKNCHKAMQPGSKLIILEMVITQGNQPSMAKLLDLEMLVTTGGRERTENEFKTLLKASGFNFSVNMPTPAGVCVIEGIRI
jgi:hypothetical protein